MYSPTACWSQSLSFVAVGILEPLVYLASSQNEKTLQQSKIDICQTTYNRRRTFESVRQSMIARLDAWIYSGGWYFECMF